MSKCLSESERNITPFSGVTPTTLLPTQELPHGSECIIKQFIILILDPCKCVSHLELMDAPQLSCS